MSWLVDTNVISELRKGSRADPGVRTWHDAVADDELFLSVLVLGEIRTGIERARRTDERQALALENWLGQVEIAFAEAILPVSHEVADAWGRFHAVRPVPVVDGLLASTALVHGLTLVTRNIGDVQDLGVSLLNPFSGQN